MRKSVLAFFMVLLASGAVTAQEFIRILPGAASAQGSGDAFFVTDVRLFNPDPENTITVHLSFLDRDADNSGATEMSVDIQPRRGVAFNDVLSTFFGLSGAVGAVRMRSDAPIVATSRTYNVGGESGTFGQFIPGLDPASALTQGILLQVVNDPAASGFRANVGFVNPGLEMVNVTVTVFDADTGELIGERNRSLPPRTFSQINNVFTFVGKTNRFTLNATVEFTAEAPVLAYASVLDNTSDDPIFVLPFADTGTPPPTADATFTKVQQEIFNPSCALSGCHSAASSASGLNLAAGAAFNNIVNVASVEQPSKDRIEPGNPTGSYLWLKVTGDSSISGVRMPRGRPALSQDRLDLLRAWIEAGAQND